eukprot:5227786-Pyramimonas_sp.AAC.1
MQPPPGTPPGLPRGLPGPCGPPVAPLAAMQPPSGPPLGPPPSRSTPGPCRRPRRRCTVFWLRRRPRRLRQALPGGPPGPLSQACAK